MWFCCSNSVPDGTCKGFLLLNGKSQNLLNKTLNEDDKIYVQNVTRMAQNEPSEETREALVKEVLRFIPHEEPEEVDFASAMVRGFSNIQGAVSPMANPNLEEQARNQIFPEICTDTCEHRTCPYKRQENYNLPCKQRWTPLRRTLDPSFEE
jgi:hypothetical protein